jgi:hypothetical protein
MSTEKKVQRVVRRRVISRRVNVRKALNAVKSSASNSELKRAFGISEKGLEDLMIQLYDRELLTEDDLERRGVDVSTLRALKDLGSGIVPDETVPEEDAPKQFLDTVCLTDLLKSSGIGSSGSLD